jgi:phosphoglycolate phosphatase-like HAD superfamily hydrolase
VAAVLVLWDIDGTLLNAAGYGWHLITAAFTQLHGDDPGPRVSLAGRTDRAIVTDVLAQHDLRGDHLVDALIDAIGALADPSTVEAEIAARGGHVLPGAGEAITALAHHDGVVQSVLSGNLARLGAAKLGPYRQFDPLDLTLGAFGDHHVVRAELVEVARAKFRQRQAGPFDTVLIGDTPLDVEAGRVSGARVVAVATGNYSVAELTACGAPVVLPDLRDTAAVVAAATKT